MAIEFKHTSVLLNETVDGLAVAPNLTYVDLTTGGGGHSFEIARRLGKGGRLICFDRDADALSAAKERLSPFLDKITFVHENFENVGSVLSSLSIDNLGGVVADLGCSSFQFDTPERGFSYQNDAPLDMRMDKDSPLSAYDVVNRYAEDELFRIIKEYGEERFASRIAARIIKERQERPITSTVQLADMIRSSIPSFAREDGPHPAKRTFQAIRIEVNRELDAITPAIMSAVDALVEGGRISIISFHSLEDRLVKNAFQDAASGCTCPRDFPICVCHKTPKIKILTKKPILPSEEELKDNPRARSAKLRVAEKIISRKELHDER